MKACRVYEVEPDWKNVVRLGVMLFSMLAIGFAAGLLWSAYR